MGNIIVCYKWVYDVDDIKISPGALEVDASNATSKISDYDRSAIETAVVLGRRTGNDVIALTFGTDESKKSLKDALSRGAQKACFINHQLAKQADGFVTAEVLAAAIQKIGNYDIIVCAEGASDTYARQVGPRIGAILGIPVLTCVFEISVEGNRLTAKRKLDDANETITTKIPAVICVLPEINKPSIPNLKQVVEASRKPIIEYKLTDLELEEKDIASKTRLLGLNSYTMNRKNVILKDGSTTEKVNHFLELLKGKGILT